MMMMMTSVAIGRGKIGCDFRAIASSDGRRRRGGFEMMIDTNEGEYVK